MQKWEKFGPAPDPYRNQIINHQNVVIQTDLLTITRKIMTMNWLHHVNPIDKVKQITECPENLSWDQTTP